MAQPQRDDSTAALCCAHDLSMAPLPKAFHLASKRADGFASNDGRLTARGQSPADALAREGFDVTGRVTDGEDPPRAEIISKSVSVYIELFRL